MSPFDYNEIDGYAVIGEYVFFRTSLGFPEQYDVFCKGKKIAYVRLREGILRVDVPDCGGTTIFQKEFSDSEKGVFNSETERQLMLICVWKSLVSYNLRSNNDNTSNI